MMLTGNTLVLPIAPAQWRPPRVGVVLDGLALQPKAELHITVVGNALGCELREAMAEAFLAGRLGDAFACRHWDFRRTGLYLLLRKPFNDEGRDGIAHSIIELVELPAMAPFHHALGRLLGRQLPVPPPHVTLYTAGRDRGIGVASGRRLRALTQRPVPAAELDAAQVAAAR
ncbi:MAG: hypothetical protein ACOH1P_04605 [Lysobacter sp.]